MKMRCFKKLFNRRPKIIKTKIVDPKIRLSEEMRKELAEEMRIRHVYTVLKDRFESTVLARVCYFKLFCHKNGKRVEVSVELYGSYDTNLYESQWTSKHGFLSKSRKEDLL